MPQPKPPPNNCVRCGVLFSAVKVMRRPSGNLQWVAYASGKTCSPACGRAWISENPERKRKISEAFTGERHWNWQGGKSRLHDYSNRGPGWAGIRAKIIERDGGKCRCCGIDRVECKARYGRDLDVDHIEPFHNFIRLSEANRPGNLMTLCASCHRKAEAKRTGVQAILPFGPRARTHKGYARGARVNTAKLTELDVRAMRRRAAAGESISTLAAEYGVDRSNAYLLVNRKIWKHVA